MVNYGDIIKIDFNPQKNEGYIVCACRKIT